MVGRVFYGFLFSVVLPALLVIWATMTEGSIPLPLVGSFPVGMAIAFLGMVIMALGVHAISAHGHGLPMTPYPPSRFVKEGIYALLPHPIYTGFSILCLGAALASQSRAGLWLVTPVVILGWTAWVQGFERHDLRRLFGESLRQPLLSLPENEEIVPSLSNRLSVYVLVFVPWLAFYETVRLIGVPPDAVVAFLSFETHWPIWEWTEIFYISAYPFVLLVPWIARTKGDLRRFSISGLISTGIIILLFVTVPLIAPPRPFTPRTLLGELLAWERGLDTPAAAFPSFHVVWGLLAASVYARRIPSLKDLWWAWGLLIALSCITTGMHALVDVLAGIIVFVCVTHTEQVWKPVRLASERIANSWREWHFGPVRVISHGLYAGLSGFAGLSIAGFLLGPAHVPSLLIVATLSVVMAALWAQFVEGSPKLLRPYGYFGNVIGVVSGCWIAGRMGTDPWLLLAAFAVAAPWIQAIGRLRCLVQGCCHGRQAPASVGIRYFHPRSRVFRIAGLSGVPVHPTPTYSILWNIVMGLVMARLWSLHVQLPLISGVYFILAGFGRFVEEAYRGEPQTPVIGRLRLYQWLAIGCIVAGAVLTSISSLGEIPVITLDWSTIAAAAGFGVFSLFAYGVDFPHSNRRFSRLV